MDWDKVNDFAKLVDFIYNLPVDNTRIIQIQVEPDYFTAPNMIGEPFTLKEHIVMGVRYTIELYVPK